MNRYQDILHRYFGYSDFRGIQKEIIEIRDKNHLPYHFDFE